MHEVAILEAIVIVVLSYTLIRLNKFINELEKDNEDLNKLRLQEVHNNTIIVEEDRIIHSKLIAIENIVNGQRTAEEKVRKIKELENRGKSI